MDIDYDHSENLHTLAGPQAALPILFACGKPSSLLDVGCGNGTWLKAAIEFGIPEVFGVDGAELSQEKLYVPSENIRYQDLTQPWNLGRKFDAVICFEVAEHLDSNFARILIDALVKHGDQIYFSAACPGQIGQHHVNCQWPKYWQELFNFKGFICEDTLRWQMWPVTAIEPWYRQNIFVAQRNPSLAGKEPRIPAVIHPEIFEIREKANRDTIHRAEVRRIEQGCMAASWYFSTIFSAFPAKVKRFIYKMDA